MLKRIKNLFKDKGIYIAIVITVVIALLSLLKLGNQPISFNHLDKIQHAIAYFTLTLFWLLAVGKSQKKRLVICVLCILYGIIIEVLQRQLTTYRFFDYADMLANGIGALLAGLIFTVKN